MVGRIRVFIAALLFMEAIYAITASPVVCYFSTWAKYRDPGGRFDVEQIDPFLCTHIIYAFVGLDNQTFVVRPLDPYNDFGPGGEENPNQGAMMRFTGLKTQNPELKTLLAVGGWGEGSESYSKMAATPELRKSFIDSIVYYLQTYNFDGIDLDWEYPGLRGGIPEDKVNFITFLDELKEALDGKYMMTAAVGVTINHVDSGYDVVRMSELLDHIHLMAYDLHVWADLKTGHHSQMAAHPKDEDQKLNLETSVDYWIEQGTAPKKLFLGMATYGRTSTLTNPKTQNGIGAPVSAPGQRGEFIPEDGFLAYYEICKRLQTTPDKWRVIRDEYYKAPYMFSETEWVSYDDVDSIMEKIALVKSKNLGGAMVWTIETDDFESKCGTKNILIQKIHDEIIGWN